MKRNGFVTFVFFMVSCVSTFAMGSQDSAKKSSDYDSVIEYAETDLSNATDDYLNYYSNIGFSVGKLILYNGFLPLLDNIIPNTALAILSKEELRILKNTIYAKHGLVFQSNDLKAYFQRFSWYNPRSSNIDNRLTNVDKRNIENILIF